MRLNNIACSTSTEAQQLCPTATETQQHCPTARRLSKKNWAVAYKDLGDPQLLSSRPAFRRWQYVLQTIVGTGERGFNTVISDSAYELSYTCALTAGSTDFRSSKEWLCIG